MPYDVNLSFFSGKPVKPGEWPSSVDTEGLEHLKSLAIRGRRMLQRLNLQNEMGTNWEYQKTLFVEDAETVKIEDSSEQVTKKRKIEKIKSNLIDDECAVDGDDTEDDNFNVTEEDLAFIDDLLAEEHDWEQYLTLNPAN